MAFCPFAYANYQKSGYPWFRAHSVLSPFLRYAPERLRRHYYPCHTFASSASQIPLTSQIYALLTSFCNAKTRSCIHKTQPHIFNFFIISKILAFIRNAKILCYEKHGFYLCFSSRNRHSLIFTRKPPLPQSAFSCIPFRRARPRRAA